MKGRGVLIAIIAGAVIFVVVWYLLLFAPASSELSDTKDEVAAAEDQKQELEGQIARLKELSNNQTQQQADLNALRAAIPPTPDLGAFILQANEIASASGVDWLSISPSPPTATTTSANSSIAISMQIEGGFFQLLDYLNRMEDMERLVIVDSVSISTGGEGESTAGGSGTTFDEGSGGAPGLSVTLTGRMFTGQAAAAPGTTTGGTATAGGGTTTPTPSTPSPTSTGAS
jgi:Tfp pilus assembly protein PilO